MARVLVPIPRRDFDPSEVAISWKVLTGLGHAVEFATPDGEPGEADPVMMTGIGLDPWGKVPGLRNVIVLGAMLRANGDARRAYGEMLASPEFRAPRRWSALAVDQHDGLVLPGGHWARGMREYLESAELKLLIGGYFAADKPVGAICHGVLLAARSRASSGKSVLYGRKTTALTWALESAAARVARIGRWWEPDYYRTYPDPTDKPAGWMSVEQEVTRALERTEDFCDVPVDAPDYGKKTSGLARDSMSDERPAWVVVDGRYVSARWPGDVHTFAKKFAQLLPMG